MAGARRLTLDEVARRPEAGNDAPGEVRFAPDGRSVTYLFSEDGSLVRSLWLHDLVTGGRRAIVAPIEGTTSEATLSRDEQLLRERTRTDELGVTAYAWADAAPEPTLLVPMGGRLYVGVGEEAWRGVHPVPGIAHADGAQLSPDGSLISCTIAGDLVVVPVRGGEARRLTDDAQPGLFSGLAEYIAAEELDRFEGAWWSADSRSIAFARVDERGIPPLTIAHEGRAEPDAEVHHYPFPGGPNARVSLWVAAADGSGGQEVPLVIGSDHYLARVVPHPVAGWLVAVLPRDQRTLQWHRVGSDGTVTELWVEHGDPWINLDGDTRVLPDGRVLRSTERSGYRHLELRGPSGEQDRVLTEGEWMVTAVVAVSTLRGEVLFTATRDGATERHLYAVPLDASSPIRDPHRLTDEPGWHATVASQDAERWIDTWSDLEHASRVTVTSRGGETVLLHESSTTATREGLDPPELVELVAADGRTQLHAAIYRAGRQPGTGDPPPCVVWVYGGPHKQYVERSWGVTVEPLRQYLAQAGATVIVVDNRGSDFRGVAFESTIAGRLGAHEVADQAAAVRQLAERGELDLSRVGIVGGSYGGFMTIMAMALQPEIFRVGVAISPVTDWHGYDTAYTERYLGLPGENPAAYRESSAISHADAVRGDLLVIHGAADENVHLRHSRQLIEAFRALGRDIDLVVLPEQRHRVRGAAIRDRDAVTVAHLLRGLELPLPEEPG